MVVPSYAVLLVLCTLMFIAVSLTAMFTFALNRADLPDGPRRTAGIATYTYVFVWISLALTLAYTNVLVPREDQQIPLLGLLILGSTILPLALLARSKTLGAVLDATPLHWLAAIQVYRIIGVVFLLLMADGYLSPYFANSTGWGDIAVGVTAPLVAYLLWMDARKYAALGLLWCAAGIGDLLLVLYKALNSAPGPLQTTAFDTPTVIVGYFPFPLIPLIVVPVSLILHVLLIRRLIQSASTQGTLSNA